MLIAIISVVHAIKYVSIDNFDAGPTTLFFTVTTGGRNPPTNWYSPTNSDTFTPATRFQTVATCLGGQRDLILGHWDNSLSESSSNMAVLTATKVASVSFPLNYQGGAYFQWDGTDNAAGAAAGAKLNSVPGIGSGGNPFGIAGQRMDFTFGNRAKYITITISCDHEVDYFFDAIDSAGVTNSYNAQIPDTFDQFQRFIIGLDDAGWTNRATFQWTNVVAFQVRIFTERINDATQITAVDTSFQLLEIWGYSITGTVLTDCQCTQINTSPRSGVVVTATNSATSQSQTATTDVNGNFVFTDIVQGSYQICIDQAVTRCATSPRCVTVTASNLVDPPTIFYYLTTTSTLIIPPDDTVQCGTCIDPSQNCQPRATLSGCSGSPTTINTWQDSSITSTNGCVRTVSRVWTNPENGQRLTQTITVEDTIAPVITTPASSLSYTCNTIVTPIGTWVSTQGGAVATDCTAVIWSNNWNQQPSGCGTPVPVTFTASDPCGRFTQTTATYTVSGGSGPSITTQASNSGAECDIKGGTDVTSFNTWINNRAGAVATDSCGNVNWSNNNSGPITSGCTQSRTVTFTATNICGDIAQTTATFTISDTVLPVITTQATPQSAQCTSGNGAQTQFQTWLDNNGGARARDNCIANDNNIRWTNSFTGTTIGSGCSEPVPVTFYANDPCGLGSTSTTATFTVSDNTPPTITTQATSRTASCSSDINAAYQDFLNTFGGAVAVDSCTGVVWTNNGPNSVSSGCNVPVVVTFSARDTCNNGPVQTTASFTVNDNTPPTFNPTPQNSGAECSTDVTTAFRTWLNNNAGALASDNCGGTVTISNDFPANGTPNLGCNAVTTVRFTARDACNNPSPVQTATFTVTDSTPPIITTVASDSLQECSSNVATQYTSWVSTRGGAQATDTCGTVTWSNNAPSTISVGCTVDQTVTFTARDSCLNQAQTTATFRVRDQTPPTIGSVAADRNVECNASTANNADLNAWLNSRAGASATDNCGAVSWTNNFVALSGGCTQSATVTFTATDGCGLIAQTTATYRITDSSPPVISPSASSSSSNCDNTNGVDNAFDIWIDNNGGARATDLCQSPDSLIWTADEFEAPDNCDSVIVTFTVTDACNLSARTTATFTVVDNSAPTFVTPPTSRSVECDGNGNVADYQNWVQTNAGATVTDSCAFFTTITSNAPNAGPVGCGSVPVVFTTSDDCNNSRTQSAIFTVVDTNPPIIVTPAANQSVQCAPAENLNQVQQWVANRAGATATDVCYSNAALTWSNNFTNLRADGCNQAATVTFSVRDPCAVGVSQTTATFSVIDSLAPTIVTPAQSLALECGIDNTSAITQYVSTRGGATASDSCSGVTWTNNFVNPPVACGLPITVTFTATDACGNPTSTSGSISIDDTEPPTFVNFPADAMIGCDQTPSTSITGVPSVQDACSTDLVPSSFDVSFQEASVGFCPGDIIITRTWTAVDECGNVNSRDQTIVQVIARNTGECTPSECPPCVEIECCTDVQEEVECIPVACTPVSCNQVSCQPVPCIPQACGVNPTPTGNPQGPVPLPSVLPAPSCEPVYIYVFDDDDVDLYPDEPNNYGQSTSSAGFIQVSFALVFLAFALMF